jgi:uncharacterized protein (TIGR01777 family)
MSLRIAIAGSSGLLGNALVHSLLNQGHSVTRVLRESSARPTRSRSVIWDPYEEWIDQSAIEGFDAFICLSGVGVAESRWTEERMKLIRDSRVLPTRFLSETLASLDKKPEVFLSSSAIGFYGSRPSNEMLDESSESGEGFLAELCREWEGATEPAETAGIRVVTLRGGIVLTPDGGALARLIPIFKRGLGGKLGSGDQIMAWIALDDWVSAATYLLSDKSVRGPVNMVAPNPVSNADFSRILGSVMDRPSAATVPAFVAKLRYGQMGEETILASQRAVPRKLMDAGFRFEFPYLREALEHLIVE